MKVSELIDLLKTLDLDLKVSIYRQPNASIGIIRFGLEEYFLHGVGVSEHHEEEAL